jgi:signal transduction histidine kinase
MTSALARKKISEDRTRAAELLDKINDSSTRMTENMQDIVWAVNPDNDSFERMIARMQQFAAQSFEAKNIQLHFSADEEMKSLKVPLQHRRDFFLIYKEAVNNVSKYSHAQHGRISLSKNHHSLQLKIDDDGIGFKEEAVLAGNGLRNMRDRAKSLNGKLQIHSEEGKGTRVILEMKV